jgi:hypothetical protein
MAGQPPPPDTIEMFDPQSGESVGQVPAAAAADLYRSGKATFEADQIVPIQTPDGLVSLTGAQAAQHLQSAESIGGGVASPQAYARQEEQKQFDTIGQGAAAVGLGAVRGLTVGLADPVITALGGEGARQYLQKQEQYNPGLSMLGEAAGMVAPLFVSGGSSAAASGAAKGAAVGGRALTAARVAEGALEAATVLPRGITRAGELASAVAGRGAQAVGFAEGGAATRAIGAAAQGAVEGAFYSVGNTISHASIQGDEITGEKLLAAAGHGMLTGGALGGVLSIGGSLASKAASKATDLATHLSGETSLAKYFDDFAQRKAVQATGANLKQTEILDRMGADVKARVAQQVTEQLPGIAGKKSLATMSHGELAQAAEMNAEKWGKQIGSHLDDLDKLQSAVRPDIGAVVLRAKQEVLAELKSNPFTKSESSALETMINDLGEYVPNPTFRELHSIRATLDKKIKYEAAAPTILTAAQKDFRRIIEDELLVSGQKAAEGVGAEFAAKYVAAKEQYRAAAWVRDATAKGANSEARNRSFGMSELMGQVTGSNAGGAVGAAIAGPVGGVVGNLVGAGIGALGQNLMRRFGDQVAATVAMRATKSDMVRALTSTLDDAVGEGVGKFFGRKAEAFKRTSLAVPIEATAERVERRQHEAQEREFQQKSANLAAFLSAPKERMAAATGALAGAPPGVAEALERKAITAAQFLQSKMPGGMKDPLSPVIKGAVAPAEIAKWKRYERAVNDPLTVIEDLKKGTLGREGVEALQAVYPQMYAELAGKVEGEVAELIAKGTPPTYEQRRTLGMLLGRPLDPSLQPRFVGRYQSLFQQPPATSGGRGAPDAPSVQPAKAPSLASPLASRADHIGVTTP